MSDSIVTPSALAEMWTCQAYLIYESIMQRKDPNFTLPRNNDGSFKVYVDDGADAFRHAFCATMASITFFETPTNLRGISGEWQLNTNNSLACRMDLWNNQVGIQAVSGFNFTENGFSSKNCDWAFSE